MMILRNSDTTVNGCLSADVVEWLNSYHQEDYLRRGRQIEPAPSHEPAQDVYDPSWNDDPWPSEDSL